MKAALGLFVALLLLAPAAEVRAGRLDDAGRTTRTPGTPGTPGKSEPSRGAGGSTRPDADDDEDDDDGSDGCDGDPECIKGVSLVAFWAVTFPWTGPYVALEGSAGGREPFVHARAPYSDGKPGILRIVSNDEPASPQNSRHRGELQLEGAYLVGNLARARGLIRWRTPWRVEPTVEWLGFAEPQPDGTDLAMLGRYTLGYRFAQRPGLAFRTGLGLLHWHDAMGARLGAMATYGMEVFPKSAWTVSVDTGLGGVGGAFHGRLRATVGYAFGRAEVFVGYDHGVLASAADTVRLTGPLLGLRFWL